MRFLYTLLWYALLPGLFVRLWWRGRQAPAYRRRWRERLGLGLGRDRLQGSIWVHAVSVGETLAAAPMIEALLEQHPQRPLVVTTMTPTGSERVQALFGDRVTHVYCPWDLPGALKRFFRAFHPSLVLVMETELWPNLVAVAHRQHVPVMLVNGRLSAGSFRGYARLSALVRPMMAQLDHLLVQTDTEAERFRQLGARPERIQTTGSIKFDLALDQSLRDKAAALRQQCGQRPVWIAASTHEGEESAALDAHAVIQQQHPQALLILVPRHPERFDAVARLIQGRDMPLARRSRDESPAQAGVYLADTMGELLMLLGAADLAFIGGSLVPVGGHNLLEPAAWSLPVLSGPALHNFERIAELLDDAGALVTVADSDQLAAAVLELLDDDAARRRRGEAAAGVVAAHRGALQRVLSSVSAEL
jgi:3-deoxy-D-manno-octulosonic-acid transferase